jgi:hypothetical protein
LRLKRPVSEPFKWFGHETRRRSAVAPSLVTRSAFRTLPAVIHRRQGIEQDHDASDNDNACSDHSSVSIRRLHMSSRHPKADSAASLQRPQERRLARPSRTTYPTPRSPLLRSESGPAGPRPCRSSSHLQAESGHLSKPPPQLPRPVPSAAGLNRDCHQEESLSP